MSDRQISIAAMQFSSQLERIEDADAVLEHLHQLARLIGLNVLGAWSVPTWARRGDPRAYKLHAHPSMPAPFWTEFWTLRGQHGRSFMADIAWRNQGPFTMTEALRIARPTGGERWIQELLYRYGAHDVFYVPNGRFMVVYWSPKGLRQFDGPARTALQFAATAAAVRLRSLGGRGLCHEPDPNLSSRQRAVLRLLADGRSLQDAAGELGIGYKTAQEHIDRAAEKLGAKSWPHAVAEALRRYLVIALTASVASYAIYMAYDVCCWDAYFLAHCGKSLCYSKRVVGPNFGS
jgi:DNA-binding CsgD family transcriptional regulator